MEILEVNHKENIVGEVIGFAVPSGTKDKLKGFFDLLNRSEYKKYSFGGFGDSDEGGLFIGKEEVSSKILEMWRNFTRSDYSYRPYDFTDENSYKPFRDIGWIQITSALKRKYNLGMEKAPGRGNWHYFLDKEFNQKYLLYSRQDVEFTLHELEEILTFKN